MPPVILSWSGMSRAKVAGQGDTGVKVYSVVGATDPDSAVALVVSTAGVDINTAWDSSDGNTMFCQSMVPNFTGPILSTVIAYFAVPPRGYFQPTVAPIQLPWKYDWGSNLFDEESDRDVDNNPIINSTYDPPSNTPRTSVQTKSLRIIRMESFYDYDTWKYYEGAVSNDDVDLVQPNGNTTTFPAGTIRCLTIAPGEAYTVNDTFLPIVVNLELWDLSATNSAFTQPFQIHALDIGSNGYYSSSPWKKGELVRPPDYNPVARDVPLNGHGVPLDTSILVLNDSQQPVTPLARDTPTGATVELVGTGDLQVAFLRWQRLRAVPFLPLLTPGGL